MDIKTIEREAVSSAVIDFGIFNSEKNDYYIKGFLTGALWRIISWQGTLTDLQQRIRGD